MGSGSGSRARAMVNGSNRTHHAFGMLCRLIKNIGKVSAGIPHILPIRRPHAYVKRYVVNSLKLSRNNFC